MRPGVIINLGNGSLGQVALSDDGVAGLVVTGTAVEGKMELNKTHLFSTTADFERYGITIDNNPLLYKDVKAFYGEAGEGAELYVLVVSEATTLTQMCDTVEGSPLRKLIDSAAGRIRIAAINKKAPTLYEADLNEGIDADTITAVERAQAVAELYASKMKPFRLLVPGPQFQPSSDTLFEPRASSYNRVGVVIASDDAESHTAAMGLVLGRAADVEPQQSLGRVKDGAIATKLYLTDGVEFEDRYTDKLFDAGYIAPIKYPTKNGVYLNGDAMACAVSDDYGYLSNGRVIDKATIITYNTYITEVLDNIVIDSSGKLPAGACSSFSTMLENAIVSSMSGQISDVSVSIDPNQNILSTGVLSIQCKITPLGTMRTIVVDLGFMNPALNN